jgi:type II secretory pathway component GspD/PulD (secretin)
LPSGTSGVSLPSAPVFNFEDLGLKLKVTPKVHGTEEVTLDIEAEYRVLTGDAVNGIPVISTRSLKDTARLKFGEWAAVAGLVTTQQARSLSGIAGVSQIPILGPLLSQNTKQDTDSQTLLVIKPHLLSNPPSEFLTRPIWLGPDNHMRIPI